MDKRSNNFQVSNDGRLKLDGGRPFFKVDNSNKNPTMVMTRNREIPIVCEESML